MYITLHAIVLSLRPRMFYSYISLENSFVSYDYETYVRRGLVRDWLDRENFSQWTQKWHQISHNLLKEIQ